MCKATFDEIREIVHSTYYYWNICKILSQDKEVIRVINRRGEVQYFKSQRKVYFDYVVLNIAKLILDPKETKIRGQMHSNLSLEMLIDKLRVSGFDVKDLERKRKELMTKADQIRTYRHKIVAHFDYEVHTALRLSNRKYGQVKKMHAISITSVDEILNGMKDFINAVVEILHKDKAIMPYDEQSAIITAENNVNHIINAMQKAIIFDELENTGKINGNKSGEYRRLRNEKPDKFIRRIVCLN